MFNIEAAARIWEEKNEAILNVFSGLTTDQIGKENRDAIILKIKDLLSAATGSDDPFGDPRVEPLWKPRHIEADGKENITSSQKDERGVTYSADGKTLIEAPRELGPEYTVAQGTVNIADDAFGGCWHLKKVPLPEGLVSIGNNAFRCGLEEINLPSTLKCIGEWAFHETKLKEIDLPDGLTDLGANAFSACPDLQSVKIPNGITIINEGAFKGCGARSHTFHVVLPESLTSVGPEAFAGCEITNIVIPPSLKIVAVGAFDPEVRHLLPDTLKEMLDKEDNYRKGNLL